MYPRLSGKTSALQPESSAPEKSTRLILRKYQPAVYAIVIMLVLIATILARFVAEYQKSGSLDSLLNVCSGVPYQPIRLGA